jgi:hypothetical protein
LGVYGTKYRDKKLVGVFIADFVLSFIEVAEGVEGLIHVSEMSWSRTFCSRFRKLVMLLSCYLNLDRDDRKNVIRYQTIVSRSLD